MPQTSQNGARSFKEGDWNEEGEKRIAISRKLKGISKIVFIEAVVDRAPCLIHSSPSQGNFSALVSSYVVK